MENAARTASKERKEKMSKYRNIKIHVPTPEISEKVQEKLFEDGCFWDVSNRHEVKSTDSQYLYVTSRGSIECGAYKSTFVDAAEKEVPYQSILDPYYDVKIAWANGEAVRYRFKGDDDWFDWNPKASIHIGRGEEWRIKPKTKTIKQWEQKYMLNCIKEVLTYQNTDKQKVIDETKGHTLIGDIYEAEYEVPND